MENFEPAGIPITEFVEAVTHMDVTLITRARRRGISLAAAARSGYVSAGLIIFLGARVIGSRIVFDSSPPRQTDRIERDKRIVGREQHRGQAQELLACITPNFKGY